MATHTEGTLACNGITIRYAELGTGQPVVVFPAAGGTLFDDVTTALADQYRVISLDISPFREREGVDDVTHLAPALARLGISSFCVVGVSNGAASAVIQAVYAPDVVSRVILVAPTRAILQHPQLAAKLGEVKAPTLVLVGTRDRSGAREVGQLCRAQIPVCHLLFVYDAGETIAAERRDACLSPMTEFLEKGEGFIVSQESQLIRP
ncbi:MAG: alpha/beta hydrolase [Deltaproteobacteria bacterium]|nr:alpha/beta hydrolase [Deltaproteobacteria bacterium]